MVLDLLNQNIRRTQCGVDRSIDHQLMVWAVDWAAKNGLLLGSLWKSENHHQLLREVTSIHAQLACDCVKRMAKKSWFVWPQSRHRRAEKPVNQRWGRPPRRRSASSRDARPIQAQMAPKSKERLKRKVKTSMKPIESKMRICRIGIWDFQFSSNMINLPAKAKLLTLYCCVTPIQLSLRFKQLSTLIQCSAK